MHFPTIALIGRYQDAGLDAPLRTLAGELSRAGRRVLIEADTAENTQVREFETAGMREIGRLASLAVVMGGDGTVLGAARHLAPYGVPLVGINHGRLGFITDIPLENAHEALQRVLEGSFQTEERMMLAGSVWRGEQEMFSSTAVNDVVINRAGRGGMIELRVELDGVYMHTQRSDGLIIATPTGSTAYAMSVNGPLIDPSLNALLLAPVAPQALSTRPIVIPDKGVLTAILTASGRGAPRANVHFDMQAWSDLQPGDRITVRRGPYPIRLVHPEGYSFFATLRRKLYWNQMPQDSNNDNE
jgi:NAD+ kinase